MGKREYILGSRQYDTSSLPRDISISDGDYCVVHGSHLNRCEFKRRTPILNWAQVVEFESGAFHIIVHDGEDPINSERYSVFCPCRYWIVSEVERGWLLHAESLDISQQRARQILSAYGPWPCCKQFTFEPETTEWLKKHLPSQ